MARRVPFVPSGGLSFVDARDAAAAFVAAMRVGRPGAAYLLAAANMSVAEYFKRIETASGVRGPFLPAPAPLASAGAALITGALGLLGRPPDPSFDPVYAEMGAAFWYADGASAAAELGFGGYRPPDETLADTVAWLRANPPPGDGGSGGGGGKGGESDWRSGGEDGWSEGSGGSVG